MGPPDLRSGRSAGTGAGPSHRGQGASEGCAVDLLPGPAARSPSKEGRTPPCRLHRGRRVRAFVVLGCGTADVEQGAHVTTGSALQSALTQLEEAAGIMDLDPGVFEVLRSPRRALEVSIPVRMDDGEIRVF